MTEHLQAPSEIEIQPDMIFLDRQCKGRNLFVVKRTDDTTHPGRPLLMRMFRLDPIRHLYVVVYENTWFFPADVQRWLSNGKWEPIAKMPGEDAVPHR